MIYQDLAAAPVLVVSKNFAFFLAFLCLTHKYANYFQQILALQFKNILLIKFNLKFVICSSPLRFCVQLNLLAL